MSRKQWMGQEIDNSVQLAQRLGYSLQRVQEYIASPASKDSNKRQVEPETAIMPVAIEKQLSSIDGLKYIPSHYLQSSPSSSHAHTNSNDRNKKMKFFNMQSISLEQQNKTKKQKHRVKKENVENKKKNGKGKNIPLKNHHIVS